MRFVACAVVASTLVLAVPEARGQGTAGAGDWSDMGADLQQMASDYADAAMGGGVGGGAPAASAMEGHAALNDLDRQLDGAASQPETDAPEIPVSCVGKEGCEECYQRTYEQLARSRILLARARALYDATHRFATATQAMGDNLAPATREAAFAWQAQKPGINASLTRFDAAYERKIADMLAALRRTLVEIGECEAKYYNNPDWFTRFGFIYFDFMKARYARS